MYQTILQSMGIDPDKMPAWGDDGESRERARYEHAIEKGWIAREPHGPQVGEEGVLQQWREIAERASRG